MRCWVVFAIFSNSALAILDAFRNIQALKFVVPSVECLEGQILRVSRVEEVEVTQVFDNKGVVLFHTPPAAKDCSLAVGFRHFLIQPTIKFENRGRLSFFDDYRLCERRYWLSSPEDFINEGILLFNLGGRYSMNTLLFTKVFDQSHTVTISAKNDIINNGKLLILGRRVLSLLVILGSSGEGSTLIFDNHGRVCIKNGLVSTKVTITGSGCISIYDQGVLAIRKTASVMNLQLIYFAPGGKKASLFLSTDGSRPAPRFAVFGFGARAHIAVQPRASFYRYDPRTGDVVLLDRYESPLLTVHIGHGYDPWKFFLQKLYLTYRDEVTVPVPPQCGCPEMTESQREKRSDVLNYV